MSEGPADLSFQELRAATELVARQVRTSGLATEEAVDARRPGGPMVEEDSARTWLAFFGWLNQQLGTPRAGEAGQGRTLSQVKFDAASDVPYPVTLASGDVVLCQPKAWYALQWMRAIDEGIRSVGTELAQLMLGDEPLPEATHAAIWGRLLEGRMLGMWLWCALEGGAGLPFPEDAIDPQPPAWINALTWRDVVEIWRGHHVPNREDLEILVRAFPGRDAAPAERQEPSDVAAALAHEWGMQASVLMRTFTVRSLYHAALVAAWNARRAQERAKPAA